MRAGERTSLLGGLWRVGDGPVFLVIGHVNDHHLVALCTNLRSERFSNMIFKAVPLASLNSTLLVLLVAHVHLEVVRLPFLLNPNRHMEVVVFCLVPSLLARLGCRDSLRDLREVEGVIAVPTTGHKLASFSFAHLALVAGVLRGAAAPIL